MIDVVFTSDLGFIEHVGVALASIAASAKDPSDVRVWIVVPAALTRHDKVAASARAGPTLHVQVVPIDPGLVSNAPLSRHITGASYYRLHLASLLPHDVERYIYLDADVVVESDLGPLASTSLENRPVAAVADGYLRRRRLPGMGAASTYFNAGVLLVDRGAWCASGVADRCVRLIRERPDLLSYHDQDALNVVLDGNWAPLEPKWNQQTVFWERSARRLGIDRASLVTALEEPCIIHFSGDSKPWHDTSVHPLRHRYVRFRRRAGFSDAAQNPGSARDRALTLIRRALLLRHRHVQRAIRRHPLREES